MNSGPIKPQVALLYERCKREQSLNQELKRRELALKVAVDQAAAQMTAVSLDLGGDEGSSASASQQPAAAAQPTPGGQEGVQAMDTSELQDAAPNRSAAEERAANLAVNLRLIHQLAAAHPRLLSFLLSSTGAAAQVDEERWQPQPGGLCERVLQLGSRAVAEEFANYEVGWGASVGLPATWPSVDMHAHLQQHVPAPGHQWTCMRTCSNMCRHTCPLLCCWLPQEFHQMFVEGVHKLSWLYVRLQGAPPSLKVCFACFPPPPQGGCTHIPRPTPRVLSPAMPRHCAG
jgi:hypothetical protein